MASTSCSIVILSELRDKVLNIKIACELVPKHQKYRLVIKRKVHLLNIWLLQGHFPYHVEHDMFNGTPLYSFPKCFWMSLSSLWTMMCILSISSMLLKPVKMTRDQRFAVERQHTFAAAAANLFQSASLTCSKYQSPHNPSHFLSTAAGPCMSQVSLRSLSIFLNPLCIHHNYSGYDGNIPEAHPCLQACVWP